MAIIKLNDLNFHYTKTGHGDPLLFLHGNDEDHRTFEPLIAKLSNDFTCYALDSRNHGQSDRSDSYDYATMMQDVKSFIEALQLTNISIIGFSDGAIITMLLAMEYPSLMNQIVLLGPNLKPTDFTDATTRYVERLYRHNPNPLYQMMLEEPNIEPEDLHAITAKTLIIGGSKDCYKAGTFEKIQANIKNSELIILENHDHSSYIFQNDLTYPLLNNFLK